MRRASGAVLFFLAAALAYGQAAEPRGEAAVASRYLERALAASLDGNWAEAQSVLERAADYASVSSDLSYLLALARLKNGSPVGAALEAAERAVAAGVWNRWDEAAGRNLEGECYVAVRSFDQAADAVRDLSGPDSDWVRLRSLKGSGDLGRYRKLLLQDLDAYPQDTRFLRLLFSGLDPKGPRDSDRELADLALARLPFQLEADPFLAVLSFPFEPDLEARSSRLQAYRAAGYRSPSSVAPALDAGLIAGAAAAQELFSYTELELRDVRAIYALLRDEASRTAFRAGLAAWTGSLSDDSDGDGRPESRTARNAAGLVSFSYDADQDGIPELYVEFADGLPKACRIASVLENDRHAAVLSDAPGLSARAGNARERVEAHILWSRFPYVQSAELDGVSYSFAPAAFSFEPLRLTPLAGAGSVFMPSADILAYRVTDRSLASFASSLSRPGSLAAGSIETVALSKGIPLSSKETLDGIVIATTAYDKGKPTLRRLDLDLDGRFETQQRLRWKEGGGFEIVEVLADQDGDGKFETAPNH